MRPDSSSNSKGSGGDSPLGKKDPPLSARSTQEQGPLGEPKKKKTSLRDHSNPAVRAAARLGFWVWVIVMVVGLGLAFLVSMALL